MTKAITRILLVFIAISIVSTVTAQKKAKTFAGTISFDIKFEGRELEPTEKAQMPTQIKMMYSGVQSRSEQISAMGTVASITNSETMASIVLFDMMGQKMAIKSTKEETEKAMSELAEATIEYSEETKTIAGYKCKKAEVTQDGKVATVYYTEEINIPNPNASNPMFKGIKGVLLEYTQPTGDEELTMKMTAKEVKKGKIKKAMFTVPAGYQELSKEEFKSMIGG